MPRRCLLWIAALWIVQIAAADSRYHAGQITVRVVNEDEAPVPAQRVVARRVGNEPGTGGYFFRGYRRGTADPQGVVVFDRLESGQYSISLPSPRRDEDPGFILPENNPLSPPVMVTLQGAEARVEVVLRLHRGVPLYMRTRVRGVANEVGGRLHLREIEQGHTREVAIRPGTEELVRLHPGSWRLVLDARDGFLLEDIELDGRSIPGSVVELGVAQGRRPLDITWYFLASAQLTGKVSFQSTRFPLEIEAYLIQPGEWFPAVDARGGSDFQRVRAIPDRRGYYEMVLPDGLWHVRPHSPDLEEAEPAEVEISLTPGETRNQDFVVAGSSEDREYLRVSVFTPDGRRRVENAHVAVFRSPWREGAEPLARKRTAKWGPVRFPDLDEGNYEIVVAHPDYTEVKETFHFDPDDDAKRYTRIRCGTGALVELTLEEPETEISEWRLLEFALERLDPLPPLAIREPELIDAARGRVATPDVTFKTFFRNLYPGRYRLTGELRSGFVELEGDGGWKREVEVELLTDSETTLGARIVPANVALGKLYCADDHRLPVQVDVRVLESHERPEEPWTDDWGEKVLLAENLQSLTGKRRNEIRVGPLEDGSYLFGFRPALFDRFSWVSGTERLDEAASVEALTGETVRIGSLAIDCGPLLQILPEVATGREAPAWDEVGSDKPEIRLSGTIVESDDGKPGEEEDRRQIRNFRTERFADRIHFRDLQIGRIEGTLQVGHRHLLPEYWIEIPVIGELERGRTLSVPLPIADIGGAVDIRWPDIDEARLFDERGRVEFVKFDDGVARFDNVKPARYRIVLCVDHDCELPVQVWEEMEVVAGETLSLPGD